MEWNPCLLEACWFYKVDQRCGVRMNKSDETTLVGVDTIRVVVDVI